MRIFVALVALVSVGAGTLAAQSAPTPVFEVADVHVSAPTMNPNTPMVGGAIREGIYELRNATMLDLIRTAYNVESDKVLGGPSWLEVDKFDIAGKASVGTTGENARLMLRAILADRFTLVVRPETRDMTTWVLSQAAGSAPQLVRTQGGIAPSCQPEPQQQPNVNLKALCRNMTMARLSEMLPRMAGSYQIGTITDATGLTGAWDFDFVFTQNRARLRELGPQGISVFDALEKQLGLKLEQKTITINALVVQGVNRTPSANPPDAAKRLPQRPAPEFEVAELKPSTPGTQAHMRVTRTGTIDVANTPLRQLINTAWGFNSSELVAGPKWIDTARFDLVGKAFTGVDAEFIDGEYLSLALRKLLVERFQMKFHYEDRPINAYALSAGNVKMTKADPSTRTRCYPGVPAGARDPRQEHPTRAGLVTCQNVTMKEFAYRLQFIAGGYVETPIAEMTGLEGGWDFTLNWSGVGLFRGGGNAADGRGGAPPPGGAGAPGLGVASVPDDAITLPEAVESQLGLRLQMGKRPQPVFVIDEMLEKPVN